MRAIRVSFIAATLVAALSVAATASAQQTRTTEVRNFTVVSVDGDKLVTREQGGAREYTVPPDFRFTVNGKQVSVSELKPGMKGTATFTTITTSKPVFVTEVRNGEVMQKSGNSIIVRGPNGIRMFSEGEIEKRGITIMKNGRKAELTDLHTGDKLTATIVTEGAPKVMTSREVQATITGGAAPAPASGSAAGAATPRSAAPAATTASRTTASPSTTAGSTGSSSSMRRLPKTASNLPLLGAIGLMLLAVAVSLRMLRRRGDVY